MIKLFKFNFNSIAIKKGRYIMIFNIRKCFILFARQYIIDELWAVCLMHIEDFPSFPINEFLFWNISSVIRWPLSTTLNLLFVAMLIRWITHLYKTTFNEVFKLKSTLLTFFFTLLFCRYFCCKFCIDMRYS